MIVKPVKGYEGYFEVSDEGKIYSCERIVTAKTGKKWLIKRKERKLQPNEKGYLRVELCRKGVCKSYFISNLVAKSFIPNPLNLPQVDHKDGNKQNNNVWNLEWTTNQENQNRSWINGRKGIKGNNGQLKHEDHPNAILTNEIVARIRKELKGNPVFGAKAKLARELNISKSLLSAVINDKIWKTYE